MEKHVLHETTDGTPQGGIISPALANCALDGLERLLHEKYPAGKRLKSLGGEKPCVNLVRYADDFVIISKSKESLEGEIKPWSSIFCKNEVLNSLRRRLSLRTWSTALISSDKTCADILTGNCSSSPPRRMSKPSWLASDEPSKLRMACLPPT